MTVLCWIGAVRVGVLILFQIVVEELSTFLWLLKWSESPSVVSDSLWPHGLYSPWNSPGQNTGVGSLYFLWGIFPTQGSNPGLPHCRWIFYQLSHKGSPTILEWVAYPFSSRSSWPRNQTTVSCVTSGVFTNWTKLNFCPSSFSKLSKLWCTFSVFTYFLKWTIP